MDLFDLEHEKLSFKKYILLIIISIVFKFYSAIEVVLYDCLSTIGESFLDC